jgi:hypothetical protein
MVPVNSPSEDSSFFEENQAVSDETPFICTVWGNLDFQPFFVYHEAPCGMGGEIGATLGGTGG